jgi:DNA primase
MSKSRKPFVDFRAIRARITMERVLQHYGVLGTFKRSGSRLSGPCPIHHGSKPSIGTALYNLILTPRPTS